MIGWGKLSVDPGYWPEPTPAKKVLSTVGTVVGGTLILAVIVLGAVNYKTDAEKFHQLTLVEKLDAWQALAERN
jgi:hypothetical protein